MSDRSQHCPWGPGQASLGKQRPGGVGVGQVSQRTEQQGWDRGCCLRGQSETGTAGVW